MKFGHLKDKHSYWTERQTVSAVSKSTTLVVPPSKKVSNALTTVKLNVLLRSVTSSLSTLCSITLILKV